MVESFIPVATLPDVWYSRVGLKTGRPGVSTPCLGEIARMTDLQLLSETTCLKQIL